MEGWKEPGRITKLPWWELLRYPQGRVPLNVVAVLLMQWQVRIHIGKDARQLLEHGMQRSFGHQFSFPCREDPVHSNIPLFFQLEAWYCHADDRHCCHAPGSGTAPRPQERHSIRSCNEWHRPPSATKGTRDSMSTAEVLHMSLHC